MSDLSIIFTMMAAKKTRRVTKRKKSPVKKKSLSKNVLDKQSKTLNKKDDVGLSLRKQQVADHYARGIKPYRICEITGLTSGRISQILHEPKVMEEIRRIQNHFIAQHDALVRETYDIGLEALQKQFQDDSTTMEQIIDGLVHMETRMGLRHQQSEGIPSSGDFTVTETHQKRISLAESLGRLSDDDRMGVLDGLVKLTRNKRAIEHSPETGKTEKEKEDVVNASDKNENKRKK